MDVARFADGEFKVIILVSDASNGVANIAVDDGILAIDDCAYIVSIAEAIATIKTADPLSIGVGASSGNSVAVVTAVVEQIGDFTFFGNGGVATLNDVATSIEALGGTGFFSGEVVGGCIGVCFGSPLRVHQYTRTQRPPP